MREALNENPVVQAVVIGILLLAGAVFFLSSMGGHGSKSQSNDTTTTASTTLTGPTGATADVTATSNGSTTSINATVSQPDGTTAPAVAPAPALGAFNAGAGLPQRLVSARDSGKTIVLYVYNPKGIDDRDVLSAVDDLKGDRHLAVYTVADKNVAHYARITQGVGLSQVPALIVIASGQAGSSPHATVSYGFRGYQSVSQAVRDAVYKGKTLGYDPG